MEPAVIGSPDQPAYAGRFKLYGPLHETEAAAREILSLPLFPEMTVRQQDAVIEALTDCLREDS